MQLVAFVVNYILKFLFVNTFALKKTDFFQFFVSLYFLNGACLFFSPFLCLELDAGRKRLIFPCDIIISRGAFL